VDGATTKLVKALAVLKVNTATTPNKREYNVFINFGFKIKNLDKNKGAGKKKSFFPEKTCAHKWINKLPVCNKKNEPYSDSLKTFIILSSHHGTGGLAVFPNVPDIDQSK
jgi:hypothetical protein